MMAGLICKRPECQEPEVYADTEATEKQRATYRAAGINMGRCRACGSFQNRAGEHVPLPPDKGG